MLFRSYYYFFCALESLSVFESLLCFWTLEGTVLVYASAFDLKSQKLTNLSFSFSWNLHFDPILFGSILLEFYKLQLCCIWSRFEFLWNQFALVLENLILIANLYNEYPFLVLNNYMDLWKRDEDELESLAILVVTSHFLVLI